MTKGLPDRRVNAAAVVGPRDVWVGTDNGVVRWNGTELTSSGLDPALRHVDALALSADRESNVWIGTTEGLLRVNAHGVSMLEDREDVADRRELRERSATAVTALFEDREGSLWIGTPARHRAPARQQLHDLRARGRAAIGDERTDPRGRGGPHLVRAHQRRTLLAPRMGA